eukprot:403358759
MKVKQTIVVTLINLFCFATVYGRSKINIDFTDANLDRTIVYDVENKDQEFNVKFSPRLSSGYVWFACDIVEMPDTLVVTNQKPAVASDVLEQGVQPIMYKLDGRSLANKDMTFKVVKSGSCEVNFVMRMKKDNNNSENVNPRANAETSLKIIKIIANI